MIEHKIVNKSPLRFRLNKYGLCYIMMIPGLLFLFINNYLPMAGLVIAFKDVNFTKGLFASDWIGFENFRYLFSTTDAFLITKNTILYNIVFISFNTSLSIFVAILLNDIRVKNLKKFYQSAILLPYLISMIIISYLANAMLNTDLGFFNRSILPLLGIEKQMWYSTAKLWPPILLFVNAWKHIGYLSILYYSAIIGIDIENYEAAQLEGATKWQQIRFITLPLISPVVITMTLIYVGRIFNSDFGLFYHVPMNSGAVYSTTNVIDTYVYRALMQLGDIGMASAAGMYQAIVGFVLVLLSNMAVRKISPDNALF